jgi:peptidoglycan hydrolase-like amidase
MAVAGNSFREILEHYYPGTVLEEFVDNMGDLG